MRDLTVVLPVLNEELNLPGALDSIADVRKVVVVDSGSHDHTREIALERGAVVVPFAFRPGGPKKKAWLLQNMPIDTEWVLLLDADERVPPALWTEIDSVLADSTSADGYYIDRELHFMGRLMRSFQPNWNLRLFRAGKASMEDLGLSDLPGTGDNEIHEHVVVAGRTGFLRTALIHDDDRGLTAWLDRHNKYATWEAHLYVKFSGESVRLQELARANAFQRKRILRRLWVRLPGRPLLRFLTWYVARRGFLDGIEGFYFCLLMAYYELTISLKIREIGGNA
jgi:glycosyltransferase involved in cell wall biosynthesis